MNLLSIELSSPQASVALFLDDTLRDERAWGGKTGLSEHVLTVLPGLLEAHGTGFDRLDAYVVGRGPGNYGGMRVALTVAQSLALPDGKLVYALASGEALAADIAQGHRGSPVAVVGDARRDRWWVGLFAEKNGALEKELDWALVRPEDLPGLLPPGTVLATSEWERMEKGIALHGLGELQWIRESRFPNAATLGALAMARIATGIPSEPLTPLYMHPPV